MIQYSFSDPVKSSLSLLSSSYSSICERWGTQDPKLAVLLNNQLRHITEISSISDISGYEFPFLLVRKTYARLFLNEIVSVQPMLAKESMVFYFDPKIEKLDGTYESLYSIHEGNGNWNISLRSGSTQTGIPVTGVMSSLSGGTAMTLSYSGGESSLASLSLNMLVEPRYSTQATGYGTTNALSNGSAVFENTLSTSSSWISTNTGVSTISVVFSSKKDIEAYRVVSSAGFVPISWALQATNDPAGTGSSAWDTLHVVSGNTLDCTRVYVLSGHAPYYTYRINLTQKPAITALQEVDLFESWTGNPISFVVEPQTYTRDLFANNRIDMSFVIQNIHSSHTALAPVVLLPKWISYEDYENTSEIRGVKLVVTGSSVSASRTRKLKIEWTDELKQDMSSMFNMSIESEMAELVSAEINEQISREVIRDLISIAPYREVWYYDGRTNQGDAFGRYSSANTSSQRVGPAAHLQTILHMITKVEGAILAGTTYAHPNWIVCSAEIEGILDQLKEYYRVKVERYGSIYHAGKLLGRLNVFVDPFMPKEYCLIGYKSDHDFQCGYIYAPYRILEQNAQRPAVTPTIYEEVLVYMHRYGSKVVDNRHYGVVQVVFPADYHVINGV